jgi:hypothetical protein
MALVRDDDGNWYDDGSDDSGNFNNFTGKHPEIPATNVTRRVRIITLPLISYQKQLKFIDH